MEDKIRTLYAVVTIDEKGGITSDGYSTMNKAEERADEIIEDIKSKGLNYKVYISELEYYLYKNTYVSNEFINDDSILLYG